MNTRVRRVVIIVAVGVLVAAAYAGGTLRRAEAQARAGDLDLLARVVCGEAQGEPYQGQVAVAAVMLNRVRSAKFPNSVSGVVFQPAAFESVSNGLIWQRSPSSENRSAARDAMNGYDPTYGCTFFWNPSKPVAGWIWSRNIAVRIGKHVFAK